jgi:hypothetical protein
VIIVWSPRAIEHVTHLRSYIARDKLDANAVIAILNDANSLVAQRVKTKEPREVAISTLVIHELITARTRASA